MNKVNTQPTHCSNCNKLGHYFRECKEPVTSYGIIAFRVRQPETAVEPAVLNNIGNAATLNGLDGKHIEFLLIQRKDTLGYVEFMRGKLRISCVDYVQLLFNQMTFLGIDRLAI